MSRVAVWIILSTLEQNVRSSCAAIFCLGNSTAEPLQPVSGKNHANTKPNASTTVLSQKGIHGLRCINAALNGVARVSESSAVPAKYEKAETLKHKIISLFHEK